MASGYGLVLREAISRQAVRADADLNPGYSLGQRLGLKLEAVEGEGGTVSATESMGLHLALVWLLSVLSELLVSAIWSSSLEWVIINYLLAVYLWYVNTSYIEH